KTCPMPGTCESFCARMESATSYIFGLGILSDVSDKIMIGASARLTLRQLGRVGRFCGNCPSAALMDACTSRAAASMLRERSNCRVMLVEPSWLVEGIWLTPAMRPNSRSSGAAPDDDM